MSHYKTLHVLNNHTPSVYTRKFNNFVTLIDFAFEVGFQHTLVKARLLV